MMDIVALIAVFAVCLMFIIEIYATQKELDEATEKIVELKTINEEVELENGYLQAEIELLKKPKRGKKRDE